MRRAARWAGAIAAVVVLAVAGVMLVAWPFLREPGTAADRLAEPDDRASAQLALAEERDLALAAIRELEFDHRTGKVSDDDYRALVGQLRRRAAEAIRALQPQAGSADDRVRART